MILDQTALHSVQLPLYRTLYCLMLMLVCQRWQPTPDIIRLCSLWNSHSDQTARSAQERVPEKWRIQRVSFNIARNKVVRLIEKAKKEAVINEIDNSKLNSRVLWKTLKSIFPTKAKQICRINSLTKDGTSYSTPEVRSNVFNEHFISIADNIIDNTINT